MILTVLLSWVLALLAYFGPFVVRRLELEIERDADYLGLMIICATLIGLAVGGFVAQFGIRLRLWLACALCAVAVATAILLLAHRGPEAPEFNHQRELIAWLTPLSFVATWGIPVLWRGRVS